MKKQMVLCIALLIIVCNGYAQRLSVSERQAMSDQELGNFYAKKGKNQNTIAWVLLSSGLVMGTVGTTSWDWDSGTGTDIVVGAGLVAALGSIPLFISGAKNKGRANVLLRNQNVPVSKSGFHYKSIGLAIPLNR